MTRIAIIGGHGKVALHLSAILTSEGHSVTSFFRNPGHAPDVAKTGATPSVLDVETASVAAMTAALRGHDAVVWSAGAGGGDPARTFAVDRDAAVRSMDAALEAGVSRYVMVSYLGARKDHGVPRHDSFFAYAEAKAAADEYLRATSLAWTILGPGALTDRAGTGMIRISPVPGEGKAETSRSNTAMVAAAVLDLPETAGRTIEFCDGTLPLAAALRPLS